MTELRWLLAGLGLIILAGVYFFWGRNIALKMPRIRRAPKQEKQRAEPSLEGTDEFVDYISEVQADNVNDGQSVGHGSQELETEPAKGVPADGNADPSDKKIVSLHVAASGANRFLTSSLIQVLQELGLTYGKFDIFHRCQDGRQDQVLFSVANMLEPGSFDLNTMADTSTPGVTLFLVLPGPIDGVQVFADMLETAKQIAGSVGGELLDGQGSSMSNQTASHLREQIIAFQLQQKRQSL